MNLVKPSRPLVPAFLAVLGIAAAGGVLLLLARALGTRVWEPPPPPPTPKEPAPPATPPKPKPVGHVPVAKGSRIALIGDSLAVGLAPPLSALAQQDGVNLAFETHGGTRPRQWAQKTAACGGCGDWMWHQTVPNKPPFNPTHVLVVLGTNDVGFLKPEDERGWYEQIVAEHANKGAHVVWIQPPAGLDPAGALKMNKARADANVKTVRGVIDSLGVEVVGPVDVAMQGDRIHPTGAGYKTWAEAIWKLLRNGG